MLPSVRQSTQSLWNSFEEAKKDIESIEIKKTTIDDLKKMGISPYVTPNIRNLSYLDIIQKFMINPSITKEDLEEGVRTCFEAKGRCKGYEIQIKNINSKRYGSVFLDLFNFRRNTRTFGWDFEAVIIFVDNVVVYKLWHGSPDINEAREVKNPLGPLQDASDIIQNMTVQSIR